MQNKDKFFMQIAKLTAQQSHCISMHVGAILTKDGRIISMGYNGTPSGFINCDKYFHTNPNIITGNLLDPQFKKQFRKIHHQWSNIHEIHAQMNAILFAAKSGIGINNSTLYCTVFPCQHCLKNIIQSGITQLVYGQMYDLGEYDNTFMQFIKQKITIRQYKLQSGDNVVVNKSIQ